MEKEFQKILKKVEKNDYFSHSGFHNNICRFFDSIIEKASKNVKSNECQLVYQIYDKYKSLYEKDIQNNILLVGKSTKDCKAYVNNNQEIKKISVNSTKIIKDKNNEKYNIYDIIDQFKMLTTSEKNYVNRLMKISVVLTNNNVDECVKNFPKQKRMLFSEVVIKIMTENKN